MFDGNTFDSRTLKSDLNKLILPQCQSNDNFSKNEVYQIDAGHRLSMHTVWNTAKLGQDADIKKIPHPLSECTAATRLQHPSLIYLKSKPYILSFGNVGSGV